jgi:RNA recognition motif-containing protein
MNTTLFVENLSPGTDEKQLHDLFAIHGRVTEVDMIVDRLSGCSRGIASVIMESKTAADAAVLALNGRSIDGRALAVNEARAI